jgi:hypothetical protein
MRPAELMPYLFDSTQFPARRRPSPDGRIRVLFYGRLEARKNPELALRTVAAARANGLPVSLTMVGRNNGEYAERVLAPLQAELGLHDVTYVPHVDVRSLREILADSDVAILASRFDNSPLTIFEALSSGVPVITSDRVGTASWIEPENGLLTLPVADPEMFARQAASAIADPAFMATGPRAAARMREKFAPELVTEQLLECYGRLMTERGGAPQPPQHIDGARARAVLSFADELVDDPSLLVGWSSTFTGADDVTLVIYAPGWSAADAGARLGDLVAAAGLDGEDAADLMAVATTPTPALEAQLASGCGAVLTGRAVPSPFNALPVVAADTLAGLRAGAQAASAAGAAAWAGSAA